MRPSGASRSAGPIRPRVREQLEERPAHEPVAEAAGVVSVSIVSRVASISRSYLTPEGQAVTQAMQPRQRVEVPVDGRG